MKPITRLARRSAPLLLSALLLAQAPLARAELLDADAARAEQAAQAGAPASQEELDRAKVKNYLATTELKERLVTLGVDGLNAQARVDAMTPQEVHALAQRIDNLPAGGALSDRDIILVLLVTLLLVVLL